MPWDARAELSALQERFQRPPVGWNCELLNARWRNFRHDLLCEGGLWLPLSSEPGKLIPGFVYLWDETLGEPAHKNGSQACYSTATELAAEEFRRLAILGGDVVSRIRQLKSELQPFVDGNGVGPPADHERWWLAYLFREVASEIVGRDLNVEAVGLGKGLTYEVTVEGVFRASDDACERLIEAFSLAVAGTTPKGNSKNAKPKQLAERFEQAYRSYKEAERQLTTAGAKNVTDRQAWEFLDEHGFDGYEQDEFKPPPVERWQRYLREGRKFYGDPKNTPRGGRAGGSIAKADEVEQQRDDGET